MVDLSNSNSRGPLKAQATDVQVLFSPAKFVFASTFEEGNSGPSEDDMEYSSFDSRIRMRLNRPCC
jgi:hypothetical protein